MKKKSVSIRAIAELAGVSISTVSRVVNNRGAVSSEHREKVRKTIEKLNYSPNRGDRRIPSVGIVIPMEIPHFSEYHSQIIDGIIEGGIKNNMSSSILLYTKNLHWKSIIPTLRKNNCDAAIVISSQVRPQTLNELERAGIPTIVINEQLSGPNLGCIDSNSRKGIIDGMDYLFSLGHERIGFLQGVKCRNHQDRLDAYCSHMKAKGITPGKHWIVEYIPAKISADSGYYEMEKLLSEAPEVTAVIATNDEIAEGALAVCADSKIKVPQDISILGFDGLRMGKYFRPELTTISQPLEEFGYKAMEALDLFLRHEIDRLPSTIYETKLVIRRSTQKPR